MPTSQDGYSAAYASADTEHIRLSTPTQQTPGPVGRRFVAGIIDGVICGVLTFPLSFVTGLLIGFLGVTSNGEPNSMTTISLQLGSNVVNLIAAFFYYGWFYSNKGATPGKLLMKLRVSHSEMGTNLSYGRAFLRETVGKFLSAIILMIGYLMAVFRDDKRALHDLLFSTQVTYEP